MHRRPALFSLLYIGVIVYLSLYPGDFLPEPKAHALLWHPLIGRRPQLDAVLNLLFYVPLGFSLALSARGSWRGLLLAGLVGASLSYALESVQLWTPSRDGNYVDWALNSVGTVLGAAVLWAAQTFGSTNPVTRRYASWRLDPVATLLCGLWVLWFAFPFIPRIVLSVTVQQFVAPVAWSWLDCGRALLGFASLRVIVGSSPWTAVCALVVLSQAVLQDRMLSPASVVGTLLGWVLAARVGNARFALALVLPGWLVIEELRPFVFSDAPSAFSWSPFESWFFNSAAAYYPVAFQKLYLYTVIPCILRAQGLGWRVATGVPLALLLAGEWLQRYIPGRTPELTDVVLCLAGITLLLLLQDRSPGSA